jgi:hypothetical protein
LILTRKNEVEIMELERYKMEPWRAVDMKAWRFTL